MLNISSTDSANRTGKVSTNPFSATSFLGKCLTVLIGVGLSWLTLTNPDVKQIAEHYAGKSTGFASENLARLNLDGLDIGGDQEKEQGIAIETEVSAAQTLDEVCIDGKCELPDPKGLAGVGLANSGFVVEPDSARLLASGGKEPQKTTPAEDGFANFSQSEEDKIAAISQQLKQMGATYLRLEKLSNPTQVTYRVRCDLANEASPLKCCFEATRNTALAAMQDVLGAVQEQSQG